MVERLIAAGQWQRGEPDIVIVTDAGYDVNRLVRALWDLPVELVGRIRSDPRDAPVQAAPGLRPEGRPAPSKHGPESRFAKPET
ncbi:transposase [Streptomyces sp. NBC_01362]|uniref:transposase n=1 Tax=Streptomyces sp. NBC_01362 TaxID=2903839 RepID=UPI003FCE98B9